MKPVKKLIFVFLFAVIGLSLSCSKEEKGVLSAYYMLGDTIVLRGRVIGTSGCFQKDESHEYTSEFDGKLWTSFDYMEPPGGWSGLDLGTSRQIGKIIDTPKSCVGITISYSKWKSLGKRILG